VSSVSKLIRSKRFTIKPNDDLKFEVETKTGSRYFLKLDNCSLTGIRAILSQDTVPSNDGLDINDIIPAAKISWTGHECPVRARSTDFGHEIKLGFC